MKKIFTLILLGITLILAATDKTSVVQGFGMSRNAAVQNALKNAVEQEYGMQFSSKEVSQMVSTETSVSSDGKDSSAIAMADCNKIDIATISKGKIKSYRILSAEKEAGSNNYIVSVEVVFPGKYVVGTNPDNRRRMAVSRFRFNAKTFSVFGMRYSTEKWSAALHDAINTNLTQSRKFTMLDRDFGYEINKELARLNSPDANQDDMIRLGQKLATDYLVVGTINFIDIPALTKNPYTGKVIFPSQAIFAEVNYRVLLAATGQLKWSDTIRIDAMQFYESFYNNSISESAEAVAQQLSSGLLSSILPYEIVSIVKNNLIVIGEGGKAFYNGEILSVFNLGEDVTDSRTGEVIDSIEVRVGMVQIIRTTEKLSYAKIISGNPAEFKVGARLRRDEKSRAFNTVKQTQENENQVQTVIQKTKTGGVVVPF